MLFPERSVRQQHHIVVRFIVSPRLELVSIVLPSRHGPTRGTIRARVVGVQRKPEGYGRPASPLLCSEICKLFTAVLLKHQMMPPVPSYRNHLGFRGGMFTFANC